MAYRRGDIVLVRFPNSDLVTYKVRPALVVQSDFLRTDVAQRLVVLITSNMGRKGVTRFPVRVGTRIGKAMGITIDSVVVVDNVSTVSEKAFYKVLGRCPFMDKVDTALRTVLAV